MHELTESQCLDIAMKHSQGIIPPLGKLVKQYRHSLRECAEFVKEDCLRDLYLSSPDEYCFVFEPKQSEAEFISRSTMRGYSDAKIQTALSLRKEWGCLEIRVSVRGEIRCELCGFPVDELELPEALADALTLVSDSPVAHDDDLDDFLIAMGKKEGSKQ
jgi:hypothetical protein